MSPLSPVRVFVQIRWEVSNLGIRDVVIANGCQLMLIYWRSKIGLGYRIKTLRIGCTWPRWKG